MAAKPTKPTGAKPQGKRVPPIPTPALTVDQVASAIRHTHGFLALTAQALGVSRRTVYNYLERNPELKEVLEEQREGMLDLGEASLYRAVVNGEAWATCFLLKTRGRKRGYNERPEDAPATTPDEIAAKLAEFSGQLKS